MLSIMLVLSAVAQAPEAKPENPPASAAPVAVATPEQALRTFLVAMAGKDEPTLRAVTLPTDDFDWLMKGQALPPAARVLFKAVITQKPIRALKPGDEVTLPGNRKVTVQPDEVTADRAVLLPEGDPVPTRVRKVEGRWRVNARPLIAARKAADAAREKAEKKEG